MGSRSEPVTPPTADHVITMCNGGVKAICNGTATFVKDAVEPTEPEPVSVGVGYTEEPTPISPIVNDIGPVCPRLIITDVDGVEFDQWEDFIEVPSSNDDSDQSDLPTVIEVTAGMNIYSGSTEYSIFQPDKGLIIRPSVYPSVRSQGRRA